jgi:DNA (cytosine-5)-methyltransferase 1
LRELSLFTGAGGGILGTKLLGWTPIGYVEWDDYCQRVLKQRQEDGYVAKAPIFGDIRTFISEGYARRYRGMVDVITAGFPCQPFSIAGKLYREKDERNKWPETIECIRIVRPKYALLENVTGLLTGGYFGKILGDLAESGYNARWRVLSAAEMGAPHKRDRLWIIAHSIGDKLKQPRNGKARRMGGELEPMAWQENWKDSLRLFRGMDDGMAYRVERIDTIRNGQVPGVVRAAWELLSRAG